MAQALVARFPERDLPQAADPAALAFTGTELRAVIADALPVARRRLIRNLTPFKQEFWPLLVALRAPEPAPEPAAAKRPKVFWKDADYDLLAAELVRANPHAGYLDTTTLAGLRPADVQAAQRALPEDRRRPPVMTVVPLRARLLAALARLRAAQPAPEPAPESVVVAAPVVNEWEAAFRPMLQLVAREFAQALQPVLQQAFTQALAAAVPAAQAAVAGAQATAVPAATVAGTLLAAARAPRILVVGPLPQQARELEQAYPMLRLTVHSGHHAGSVKDSARCCDRAIGMTKFMNHPVDGMLNRLLGERYTRVAGGVSDIKRQLDVWLKSGQLGPRPS